MINDKKPMLLVFAGPNGSGKSSITDLFKMAGEYTNADDIVRTTGIDNREATILADKKRYAAIDERRDFTFETVLSSGYKMDILRKAKKEGYFLKCVYVLTVDPEINMRRVWARVANGGHDVDDEKINSRYYKSIAHIPELMQMCDIMHIYDNSEDSIHRIVRKHKEEISIFPNALWDEESIMRLIAAG